MGIDINDSGRRFGHFALQRLNVGGEVVGELITVTTFVGILLNCHPKTEQAHAERIAEMARDNPNQPYDISAWSGPTGARVLLWSARIHWRE